jgi:ERCC4-type nuclease
MSIELVIDNREHELILKLQSSNSIKVEQLEVGDILFRLEGETVLIIERKTVNDLKASICDGRGREQKARLIGSTPRQRIIYLIEGSLDKTLNSKIGGIPVSTLIGSLINTQLRDGIKVYKTSTIDESAEFIIKLYEKLEKDGDTYFMSEDGKSSDSTYAATLKKSKKANMTPKIWFISQLSLIPQVTEKVSAIIVEKYPSVRMLIQEYEKTPEHLRIKLLSDLTFTLATGASRRIGDKMSARIYHFLYGIVNDISE